jgi:hypothetical protein
MIRAHQRLTLVDIHAPASPTAAVSESGLLLALRSRIIAKDKQFVELKSILPERGRATATPHAQIDKTPTVPSPLVAAPLRDATIRMAATTQRS